MTMTPLRVPGEHLTLLLLPSSITASSGLALLDPGLCPPGNSGTFGLHVTGTEHTVHPTAPGTRAPLLRMVDQLAGELLVGVPLPPTDALQGHEVQWIFSPTAHHLRLLLWVRLHGARVTTRWLYTPRGVRRGAMLTNERGQSWRGWLAPGGGVEINPSGTDAPPGRQEQAQLEAALLGEPDEVTRGVTSGAEVVYAAARDHRREVRRARMTAEIAEIQADLDGPFPGN